MCRNIRVLFNFAPPATDDEIHASALQYVRKVSGMQRPSAANRAAFDQAVADIVAITQRLLREQLRANGPTRDRTIEAAKARARGLARRGPTEPGDARSAPAIVPQIASPTAPESA